MVQNLGFIPNLKKSDLMPTQRFIFIGMEFLTQQEIVRVPADRVKDLILTIQTFLSQTQVLAWTFLSLLVKLSAAADLIILGRLHLRPLQMCLLSVWKPHILPLDHQVTINSITNSIWNGGWTLIASFKEYPFTPTSPLPPPQTPKHSFIRMPVITVGELIWNRWVYPFMVAGRKTNHNSISACWK